MEKPDIAKIYADMDKRPLSDEEISAISKDFLEKTKNLRSVAGVKVETIIDDKPADGYSWSVKVTVPPGLLPPEIEEEWRKKNELEKGKSPPEG